MFDFQSLKETMNLCFMGSKKRAVRNAAAPVRLRHTRTSCKDLCFILCLRPWHLLLGCVQQSCYLVTGCSVSDLQASGDDAAHHFHSGSRRGGKSGGKADGGRMRPRNAARQETPTRLRLSRVLLAHKSCRKPPRNPRSGGGTSRSGESD